ncbi:MAG: glutathione S-transferase family protein [Acidobacteria bacterium]|nr:glutathione S-transferase family protein [Acidobacteriota bacterium]
MKLYYSPISTYSQKALMGLYEKNAAFDREVVKLTDPDSRAAFSELYRVGKVPLLVLDDGYKIPESSIIIEYLEGHISGGTKLIPSDKDAARKVRFLDRACDLYLNNATTTLLFDMIKFRPFLEQDLETARKHLGIACDHLDSVLGEQEWLGSEGFSMADCAAIPTLFYTQVVHPIDGYQNLSRYWAQAQNRPSYQKVRAEFEPIWQSMMGG